MGGSPLRILRLTPRGTRFVERLVDGEPVPPSREAQRLVRRLLDGGLAHPRPGQPSHSRSDVTVVIPVRDQAGYLADTLPRLDRHLEVIVVDDGSIDDRVVDTARQAGVTVLRAEYPRGPAAARNRGWRQVRTDLIAFLDAGCVPAVGWLDQMLAHFGDPTVAAVAPRISGTIPRTLPSLLARYEAARPTLDRGGQEARVQPRSRVPFVPTTASVIRRHVLEQAGGFDESLRFGADVDLIWRLVAAGWTIRYDPAKSVAHPARSTTRDWLRQRFDYGTSAAPLARRHGNAVAPAVMSPWSALVWVLAGIARPLVGAVVGAASTALLAPRLKGVEHPWGEALRLAGKGHLYAGLSTAAAARRAWWPFAAVIVLVFNRPRRGLLAAATIPSFLEWRQLRPNLDPASWVAIRLIDDLAYGAGVWAGCFRERSLAALRPDLTSWPGRRPSAGGGGMRFK